MVSDVTEAPIQTELPTDPEPQPQETETPAPIEVPESAAPEAEDAAVQQVEITEEKPNYLTREEWEKEKAEVAKRAADEALEADRRRRQTEGARKAQAEERQKARIAQTVDTVKSTLVARGLDPDVATDETVVTAIDRVAQERAEQIVQSQSSLVGDTWDYLTAKVYNQDIGWDDTMAPVAQILSPRIQHLIDTMRPAIEAEARKGYTADSEIPAKVDAEIARRQAKAREGQEELKRPSGQPSSPIDRSDEARTNRIIAGEHDDDDKAWWDSRFGKKG